VRGENISLRPKKDPLVDNRTTRCCDSRNGKGGGGGDHGGKPDRPKEGEDFDPVARKPSKKSPSNVIGASPEEGRREVHGGGRGEEKGGASRDPDEREHGLLREEIRERSTGEHITARKKKGKKAGGEEGCGPPSGDSLVSRRQESDTIIRQFSAGIRRKMKKQRGEAACKR